MQRKSIFIIVLLLGLLGISMFANEARAISVDVSASKSTTLCDVGDSFSVTLSFSSDTTFTFSGNISVSGATIDSVSGATYANGTFMNYNGAKSYSVVFNLTATSEGDCSISFSNIACPNIESPSDSTKNYKTSVGPVVVHVRTQEEIDASIEASEEESRVARSIEESLAEESRRAEESRQESLAEESRAQASRDASIAAAEEARRQSLQEEEERRNSEEASRQAAEDESRRASEEESIAESIRQSSIGNQSETSGSEEKTTESTEKKTTKSSTTSAHSMTPDNRDITYYSTTIGRKTFYFASAKTAAEPPENVEKVDLQINGKDVLAFRGENYQTGLYLVYGALNAAKNPEFYYYDSGKDLLFTLSMVPVTKEDPTETLPTAEPEPVVPADSEIVSTTDLMLLCALSVVLGAGLTFLVTLLCRRKKREEEY